MTFLLTWGFGHVFCLFAECFRGAAGNRPVLAVKLPENKLDELPINWCRIPFMNSISSAYCYTICLAPWHDQSHSKNCTASLNNEQISGGKTYRCRWCFGGGWMLEGVGCIHALAKLEWRSKYSWANDNDLSRGHLNWWFVRESPLQIPLILV